MCSCSACDKFRCSSSRALRSALLVLMCSLHPWIFLFYCSLPCEFSYTCFRLSDILPLLRPFFFQLTMCQCIHAISCVQCAYDKRFLRQGNATLTHVIRVYYIMHTLLFSYRCIRVYGQYRHIYTVRHYSSSTWTLLRVPRFILNYFYESHLSGRNALFSTFTMFTLTLVAAMHLSHALTVCRILQTRTS